MCGRYSLTVEADIIAKPLGLDFSTPLAERYNIAPGESIPIIKQNSRVIDFCRWGLVTSWNNSEDLPAGAINIGASNLAAKSMRQLSANQRCLIPASGFYLWISRKNKKQAYYASTVHKSFFFFAGIWDKWQAPNGAMIETVAILTTMPNQLLCNYTKKMPVIVRENYYHQWLHSTNIADDIWQKITRPLSGNAISLFAVTNQVNNPQFDEMVCIKPLTSMIQER